MNQLTEAKELNRQAAEKIKEYELMEEARRRGFVPGVKFISIKYGGTNVLENGVFIYKDDDGTHLIDNKPGDGNFIYDAKKGWAEIIPEEEKKEIETALKLSTNNMSKTTTHIHDQIREGGWEKVIELVKSPIGYFKYSTVLDMNLFDVEANKGNAYYKLRALSKVLNEGKERPNRPYTITNLEDNLTVDQFYRLGTPVEIFELEDAAFALEFAEKEWKLFYNAKQ